MSLVAVGGGLVELCGVDRSDYSTQPLNRLMGMGGDLATRMAVVRPHVFDGVPLTDAAAAASVPFRTAQRCPEAMKKPAPLATHLPGFALHGPPDVPIHYWLG